MNEERLYTFTEQELSRLIQRSVAAALRENAALNALGDVLVEGSAVTRNKKLNKNTLSQSKIDKFNQGGSNRILMKLEDVTVLKSRRRKA